MYKRRNVQNDGKFFFKRAFTPELVMDLLTTGQVFAPFIEWTEAESEAGRRSKKRRQIALGLLAMGMSVENVAAATGMEVGDVKELTGG
jgi:hypothetical protein